MVVFSHVFYDRTSLRPFGQNGVEIFFVLSGFLITSLLLDDVESGSGIQLRRFYGRRARRLAPALFVVIAFVVSVAPLLGSWWTTPRQILAALTWSSNWVAPSTTAGVALAHTWSLAVEEQFYLVWPWLLLLVVRLPWRSRRAVMLGAIGVGIVLPFLPFMTYWAPHLYFGTDSRSLPLLAGALLAMVMRRRPEGDSHRWVAAGGLGLVLLISIVWTTPFLTSHVAGTFVTAATVVVIWASAQGRPVGGLSSPLLRYVGHRSYALYLWHPVLLWLAVDAGVQSTAALFVIVVGGGFALAECTWRLVEKRYLHPPRRAAGRPQEPVASPTAPHDASVT
jgi:peptidoglycan/LPS O-acetylase OafA/YrhL